MVSEKKHMGRRSSCRYTKCLVFNQKPYPIRHLDKRLIKTPIIQRLTP